MSNNQSNNKPQQQTSQSLASQLATKIEAKPTEPLVTTPVVQSVAADRLAEKDAVKSGALAVETKVDTQVASSEAAKAVAAVLETSFDDKSVIDKPVVTPANVAKVTVLSPVKIPNELVAERGFSATTGGQNNLCVRMSQKMFVPTAPEADKDGYISFPTNNVHIRKESIRYYLDEEGEQIFVKELGKGIQLSVANKQTPECLRTIARACAGYADYVEALQARTAEIKAKQAAQ